MNAPLTFIVDLGNRIGCAGQTNTVSRAATIASKKATKGGAKLRGAGVVRYWFNDTRPGRAAQSYAGLAG